MAELRENLAKKKQPLPLTDIDMTRFFISIEDAVNFINMGDYRKARSALKPVIGIGWEYLVIYLMLFLPISNNWLRFVVLVFKSCIDKVVPRS